jgi:hypothetical protein
MSMMAKPAPPPELPQEIAREMANVGLAPEVAVLQKIIAEFARARAAPKVGPALEPTLIEQFPLKGLLPTHVSYQTGRRQAEAGTLRATKIGGRWFATRADVESWLAATGRFVPRA